MTIIPTILKAGHELSTRLGEFRLNQKQLLAVGAVAMDGRSQVTSLHPRNGSGTRVYQDGVAALRAEFLGKDGWRMYEKGGVEGIWNEQLNLVILFKNADRCCFDGKIPKINPIGASSEKLFSSPLFEHVGVDLPPMIKAEAMGKSLRGMVVLYLLIDPEGRLELNHPIFKNKEICASHERIYLNEDATLDPIVNLTENTASNDDDPVVTIKRKNET